MSEQGVSPEVAKSLRTIDFGLEVQQFLKTRVGAHLVAKAESEIEAMTQELKHHDVLADAVGAKNLQMEIKCRESILYWLGDAVREGAELMDKMISEERQSLGVGDDAAGGDATGS